MAIIKVITPSVTDANITTAKVTDNAITLAKMASGTDGNIISYDASGNPVAIATGSDGQILTSTGAGSPPAFEAAGGGKILNVYQVSYDTDINTTSNTYQTTSLTKTLTPSSTSSDFLIQFNFGVQTVESASDTSQYVQLKRGSTVLNIWSDGYMLYEVTGPGTRGYPPGHFLYVDQPSTTSEITYSVEYKSEVNTKITGSYGNKTMIVWEIEGVS